MIISNLYQHINMELIVSVVVWPLLIALTEMAKKIGLPKNLTIAFMTVVGAVGYALFVKYAPIDLQREFYELTTISVTSAGVIYQTIKMVLQ